MKTIFGPTAWTRDSNRKILFCGIKGGILSFIAFYIFNIVMTIFGIQLITSTSGENLDQINSLILIVSVLVVGPILEEILCRRLVFIGVGSGIEKYFTGVLDKEAFDLFFMRNSFTISSILSGFLFISIHQSPVILWPLYMLISLIFCNQYQKTGSLLTPITSHFTFNLIQLILLLV